MKLGLRLVSIISSLMTIGYTIAVFFFVPGIVWATIGAPLLLMTEAGLRLARVRDSALSHATSIALGGVILAWPIWPLALYVYGEWILLRLCGGSWHKPLVFLGGAGATAVICSVDVNPWNTYAGDIDSFRILILSSVGISHLLVAFEPEDPVPKVMEMTHEPQHDRPVPG